MWLPQQSSGDWLESVEALVDVAPEHASLYLLELYPNAPLKEHGAGGWSQAPDDDAAEMYLWSMERLERPATGSTRSRTSRGRARVAAQPEVLGGRRVARVRVRRAFDPRRRPLEECLRDRGLHSAESSTDERFRSKPADLPPCERAEEALFTGLRLAGGVDIAAVGARYGMDTWGRFGAGPRALHRGGDGPP